jgi:MmyB-like transcription regulator ligand binding domain
MMNIEPDASHTPDVLRDVLEEIETLRMKRQEEGRDRPHPFLKRFTQQELTDEACPTYKNLLVGRSQRLPSRQTLMQVADYLECSMESRNNLLLAARYLPESLELEGDALRLTLAQARQLMETLPYPAMLVTHTLAIEALNESFQRFFAFPPLLALPRTQRYVLPVLFREDLPIRERSSFNDQAVKAWQAGVSRGIQLFKQSNRLSQFEPWYHELVKQFCAVADFRRYWERTPSLCDQHDVPAKLLLGRNATTEEWLPIELQHIRISVCSHMYPCIIALRPLDDAARDVFASLSSAQESPLY